MKTLADIRQDYAAQSLDERDCLPHPMAQFECWLEAALTAEVAEPTAMLVSTVSPEGRPAARVVLLKGVEQQQLVFYTNYESRKGKAIESNHKSCLHFFWPTLERQIIIKADLERLPENLSDGYFQSRPKGSQLGAVVSPQSQVIPDRDYLENKLKDLEKKFENKEVPRPENWGGYLAKPYEIEFWQGRPNRLHDRLTYERVDHVWKLQRLMP